MKKIFAIVILFLLILAAITNPTKPEYVTWLKEKAIQDSNNALSTGVISLLGGSLIDSGTAPKNFVFFTIFTTNISGENAKVIGLFHNFIPLGGSSPSTKATTTSAPPVTSNFSASVGQPVTPTSVPQMEFAGSIPVISSSGTYKLLRIGIKASYGIPTNVPIIPQEMAYPHANITADMANQLALFVVNEGNSAITFLAPKDWKAKKATIGVNGSVGITLVSNLSSPHPQSLNIMKTYSAGSVSGYIGTYFPSLRDWAVKNSPTPITTIPGINIVELKNHAVSYSYKNPSEDFATNGVAVENHDQQLVFAQADMVSDNKDIATVVLDYYLQTLSKYRN